MFTISGLTVLVKWASFFGKKVYARAPPELN